MSETLEALVVRVVLPGNRRSGASSALTARAMASSGKGWDIPITSRLLKQFGASTSLCFYASEREDGSLRLSSLAPWQSWA